MGWLPEGLHRRRRRTISFKPNSGLRPPGGRRYSVLVEVFQQSDQKGNINAGLRLQYFVRTGEARLGIPFHIGIEASPSRPEGEAPIPEAGEARDQRRAKPVTPIARAKPASFFIGFNVMVFLYSRSEFESPGPVGT